MNNCGVFNESLDGTCIGGIKIKHEGVELGRNEANLDEFEFDSTLFQHSSNTTNIIWL